MLFSKIDDKLRGVVKNHEQLSGVICGSPLTISRRQGQPQISGQDTVSLQ